MSNKTGYINIEEWEELMDEFLRLIEEVEERMMKGAGDE